MKVNEPDHPRIPEFEALAKRLYQARRNQLNHKSEFRKGILSVFDTLGGVTVRLYYPENASRIPKHDLVYAKVRDWDAESNLKALHGVSTPIYTVGTFNPELADAAVDLMRRELVLDDLASV